MTLTRAEPASGDGNQLALDAGQTATKVRIRRPGVPPESLEMAGVQTHRPLLPQLRDIIRALGHAGLRGGDGRAAVAVGVSGLTAPDADAADLLRLLDGSDTTDAHIGSVRLAHDSVTGYLGALGAVRGVVVAAGTGVVTLGVGARSVARVDGWGHLMGDAGSAYWVGRAALEAVMRAHDGRGPATALRDVVQARWPELEDAYVQLQRDPAAVSVVGSFARAVGELADSDEVARRITVDAAAELAHSASTALRRVGEDGADARPQVAAVGGTFRSAALRRQFRRRLAQDVPEARFREAGGEGVDGAVALLGLAEEHPLHRLVSVASRQV
ncbi:BadF/BadG/BcrA/BcrD ATPase family protein [Nesterenkonia suensis]